MAHADFDGHSNNSSGAWRRNNKRKKNRRPKRHRDNILLSWAMPIPMMEDEDNTEQPAAAVNNISPKAREITSSLSLQDKCRLISGKTLWTVGGCNSSVPTIRVADGPHGVRKQSQDMSDMAESEPATCFPMTCALASGWNVALCRRVGRALADECRLQGVSVLLGPGMNIKRHPCGGRNMEYFSEDPYLTGRLAAGMVQGIQQDNNNDNLVVGACLKHVCVNHQEEQRFCIDVQVDTRTLMELYLRAFQYVLKTSRPLAMMCAYNKLVGTHCSEHEWLFSTLRKHDWNGLVMTDWGATNYRVLGIKAGIDLEMPGSDGVHDECISQALADETLSMSQLDACVARVVDLVLRCDGEKVYTSQQEDDIYKKHDELAYRAALECPVLLKNDDGLLPLSKEDNNLAVIGAFAKHPRIQGMGSSKVHPIKIEAALDRFYDYYSEEHILYAPGYRPEEDDSGQVVDRELLNEAVAIAKDASVALVFCGLPQSYESEGFDRNDMEMPWQHVALIQAVANANPNTVVVISNGGPISMKEWIHLPKAVLEAHLLGQAGGRAVVDLLFGMVSPSGKLAETFPISLEHVPAHQNFGHQKNQILQYRECLNVGYRAFDTFDKNVLFPFGHGLSYTTFAYHDLKAECHNENKTLQVTVSFKLENTGSMKASEVSQCYIRALHSKVFRPRQELQAFHKCSLAPGESQTITMHLDRESFVFYDVGHAEWIVEEGVSYEICIGSSSRDIRLTTVVKLDDSTDTKTASLLACELYPPNTSEPLVVDDWVFARLLGHHPSFMSQPTSSHFLIHRDTLLPQAAQRSYLGWAIFEGIKWSMTNNENQDANIRKMMIAFVNNAPMRILVLFGKGYVSFAVLDILMDLMNGFYFRAMRGFIKILRRFDTRMIFTSSRSKQKEE